MFGVMDMADQNKDDLGLKEGMRLELLSEFEVFLFNGVLSKIDEDAIWVANANGGDVPSIIYNTNVRLKGIRQDSSAVILFGKIRGSTPLLWKIGEVSQYSFYNKRSYYRQSVSIETTVYSLRDEPEGESNAYSLSAPAERCKILNISGGGLQFSSNRQFPLNTSVQIGDITLRPAQAPFSLKCSILRVTENGGRFFHGCQFIDLDGKEQERLIRDVFLLQGEEIRRRNKR